MFSILSEREIIISAKFFLSSANAFNLDQSKILSFDEELISTFQLLSAASLNLGRSQNRVLGNVIPYPPWHGPSGSDRPTF